MKPYRTISSFLQEVLDLYETARDAADTTLYDRLRFPQVGDFVYALDQSRIQPPVLGYVEGVYLGVIRELNRIELRRLNGEVQDWWDTEFVVVPADIRDALLASFNDRSIG